jgi:hypothetical protein
MTPENRNGINLPDYEITITIGKCPRCGQKHTDIKLVADPLPWAAQSASVLRMMAECPVTNEFIVMTFWTDVTR